MPGDNGLFVSTGLDKVLKVLLQELRATVQYTYEPISSYARGFCSGPYGHPGIA